MESYIAIRNFKGSNKTLCLPLLGGCRRNGRGSAMNKLIDKLIIFILCLCFYLPSISTNNNFMIVPVLIAIIISAAFSYFENDKFELIGIIVYIYYCFTEPSCMFFLPLLCYDILKFRFNWIMALISLPLAVYLKQTLSISYAFTISLIGVAFLFRYRTVSIEKIKRVLSAA